MSVHKFLFLDQDIYILYMVLCMQTLIQRQNDVLNSRPTFGLDCQSFQQASLYQPRPTRNALRKEYM